MSTSAFYLQLKSSNGFNLGCYVSFMTKLILPLEVRLSGINCTYKCHFRVKTNPKNWRIGAEKNDTSDLLLV